jgi:hypothetical protein
MEKPLMIRLSILATAAALIAGPAAAHVVFAEPQAAAGSYYAGFLRIGHGCSGSPTVRLRVEIPAGVLSAKPQPKPGWTVEVEREPLAKPVTAEGREVRERVKAITWTGRLPDDEFDQFGLMLKLPAQAGPLYFPLVQTCETGERRWVDIPAAGQAWHDLKTPAPVVVVAAGEAGHHH